MVSGKYITRHEAGTLCSIFSLKTNYWMFKTISLDVLSTLLALLYTTFITQQDAYSKGNVLTFNFLIFHHQGY